MRFWLFLLGLLGCSVLANAQESLSVCFNYGCLNSAEVHFSPAQLDEVQALLGDAASATHERALLAVVIGRLLCWAGEQSPIHADRGAMSKMRSFLAGWTVSTMRLPPPVYYTCSQDGACCTGIVSLNR